MSIDLAWRERAYAKERARAAMFKSEDSLLVRLIKKRLDAKYDARIIISGPSGVGKSTLALDLAEKIDPKFMERPQDAAKENITFSALQFVKAQRILPERSVIIPDESGQSTHHRRFMSAENVGVSSIYIGMRYKLYAVFECVPALSLLDADLIRQAHYLCVVHRRGSATVYRIMQPELRGDIFWEKITDDLRFGMPGKALWDAYMSVKVESQESLHKRLEKELEDSEAPRVPSNPFILAQIAADVGRFTDITTRKISAPLIQRAYPGLGLNRSVSLAKQAASPPQAEG